VPRPTHHVRVGVHHLDALYAADVVLHGAHVAAGVEIDLRHAVDANVDVHLLTPRGGADKAAVLLENAHGADPERVDAELLVLDIQALAQLAVGERKNRRSW
jgi:hypothetical protein